MNIAKRTRRSAFIILTLAGYVSSVLLASPAVAQNAQLNPSVLTTIRVAPPAPVFNDDERRAELVARRARVAKEIGSTGVLVLFSAEPRIYTNDVDYEYRQENNFYYLTHLKQQGATLVLLPGNPPQREILFLPRRNPARETWDGYMYSPEQAQRLSGVAEIWDAREFQPFADALRARTLYRPKPENVLLTGGNTGDAAKPVAEFQNALMKGERRNTGATQNDLALLSAGSATRSR